MQYYYIIMYTTLYIKSTYKIKNPTQCYYILQSIFMNFQHIEFIMLQLFNILSALC